MGINMNCTIFTRKSDGGNWKSFGGKFGAVKNKVNKEADVSPNILLVYANVCFYN